MKARQVIFSDKDKKIYCLSPYVTCYKASESQILLYRSDTKKRVLLRILDGSQWNNFEDTFSVPISAERILSEICNWVNTNDPVKVLDILVCEGVLESCG